MLESESRAAPEIAHTMDDQTSGMRINDETADKRVQVMQKAFAAG